MGVMFLITSSMMSSIYEKYCSYMEDHDDNDDYDDQCGKLEKHFLILPILGYFTMVTWVRYLLVTVTKHFTLK